MYQELKLKIGIEIHSLINFQHTFRLISLVFFFFEIFCVLSIPRLIFDLELEIIQSNEKNIIFFFYVRFYERIGSIYILS
jgi:hypothetical protein